MYFNLTQFYTIVHVQDIHKLENQNVLTCVQQLYLLHIVKKKPKKVDKKYY
jgi:hypothetical protein